MAMTVKSGRWSDPTVWDTGTVPGAGAMAHIMAPHQIIYDRESDVILEDVMSEMGSKLTWDSAKETRLRANTVMLSGITEIVDKGLSATPGKPKHEIVFHPIAGKDPGAGMGLGAVFKGPTRIHGYAKKGHLRSGNISIPAGATTIHVPGLATSGWQVGDELVILGTEYVLPATSDPQYSGPTQYYYAKNGNNLAVQTMNSYQFGQDEQRRIVSRDLSAETITLNAPLDFAHAGMTGTLKDGQVITVLPVIANVSRSIRFRTATAEEDGHLDPYADITVLQKRAHLMFMRQPDVDLRYFETKNMGRTSTDPSLWVNGLPYRVDGREITPLLGAQGGVPLADPDNVRGRYAIHLHWCGGPYHSSPMVPLIGATAWAPIGGVPIPGWGIAQHSTRAAIEDCVISNVRGAGLVSEIGNETGQWVNNVVTGVRGDGDRAADAAVAAGDEGLHAVQPARALPAFLAVVGPGVHLLKAAGQALFLFWERRLRIVFHRFCLPVFGSWANDPAAASFPRPGRPVIPVAAWGPAGRQAACPASSESCAAGCRRRCRRRWRWRRPRRRCPVRPRPWPSSARICRPDGRGRSLPGAECRHAPAPRSRRGRD